VEHNAVLSDLKEKHEIEKNLLLNEQKELMLDQHSVVLMKLNEEFNKCKLELEEQLKLYTDKEWKDVEIQTDTCEKVYCAIQTTVPSYASVELQTESNIGLTESQCQTEYVVTSVHTQTETNKSQSDETQTDQREVIQDETQTNSMEVNHGETQTDLREVIQVEMQTDSWVGVLGVTPTEVEDQCVQTDMSECIQSTCQTDKQETCDQESQIVDDTESYKQVTFTRFLLKKNSVKMHIKADSLPLM
jgi:hypothetical protein